MPDQEPTLITGSTCACNGPTNAGGRFRRGVRRAVNYVRHNRLQVLRVAVQVVRLVGALDLLDRF